MVYRITAERDYLRAELFDRETEEETRSFLGAIVRDNAKYLRPCILILVRASKPIFQVAPHRLIESFEELSTTSVNQIALVGDTTDLHMSHEYIELIARQHGLNVQGFRDEAAAIRWFNTRRRAQDRRRRQGRRYHGERRQRQEQRYHEERRYLHERRGEDERRRRQRRASPESHQLAG